MLASWRGLDEWISPTGSIGGDLGALCEDGAAAESGSWILASSDERRYSTAASSSPTFCSYGKNNNKRCNSRPLSYLSWVVCELLVVQGVFRFWDQYWVLVSIHVVTLS